MLSVLAKFTQKLSATCKRVKWQQRHLHVHENQAYTLLNRAGIPTPAFGVAKTPQEAEKIAKELDTPDLVIKAQVHAGGRGKGQFKDSSIGGVIMCDTPDQVKDLSSKMIGKHLVTKQTGAAGRICNSVMITTRCFTRRELYLSVMMERSFGGPVVIASTQGGVNIEEVAASNPKAITYMPIDINVGLTVEHAEHIACSLGVCDPKAVTDIVLGLYELFVDKDALLLEINPLVQDICGRFLALDCKCNFDDESKFRQKELFEMEDFSQISPQEIKAKRYNLNFIALDGNIGCMVNGAGLAMATMDIIKLSGGDPANFLDVGGGATVEAVTEAFKIITSDPKVESIFVNIFGGIIRCDVVANGIISASSNLKLEVPIVVRLQGTNADAGKKLINEAKLKIIPVDDMAKAAEVAVVIADICRRAKELNLNVNITPKAPPAKSC